MYIRTFECHLPFQLWQSFVLPHANWQRRLHGSSIIVTVYVHIIATIQWQQPYIHGNCQWWEVQLLRYSSGSRGSCFRPVPLSHPRMKISGYINDVSLIYCVSEKVDMIYDKIYCLTEISRNIGNHGYISNTSKISTLNGKKSLKFQKIYLIYGRCICEKSIKKLNYYK